MIDQPVTNDGQIEPGDNQIRAKKAGVERSGLGTIIQFEVEATQAGVFTITVDVRADESDPNLSNNESTVVIMVLPVDGGYQHYRPCVIRPDQL